MANIVNKLKYIMGIDDLEYEEEEEQYVYEEEEDVDELPATTHRSRGKNKIVNIHTTTSMKLSIHEPLNYEDAPKIIDDLKKRKTVVVNLEQLEPGIKRQIFDFINGGIYSLEGTIQKVSTDIFVLAPANVEVDGNIKEQLNGKFTLKW
jgi:cell division inhibitor SepF